LLAALRAEGPPAGRCVLLPRAEGGREVLARGLREAGARVVEAAVYRTDPVPGAGAAVDAALRAGRLDALLFASPSAVRAVASELSEAGRAAAARALVGAIGPTTAAALREAGLAPDAVPGRHTAEDLVAALAACAAARGVRRGPGGGGA
ncbi:MAG: uroporphyrinogen-III synthase, partial [Myxococcota bacterium]|nr:uroporphyrinogen-III synthase [Myxococcota bacterium]